MKLTTRTKPMNKVAVNIIAIVAALSLVFLQTPIFNSSQARADAAAEVSAQAIETGSVDVKFSFDHAFVTYDGQVLAPPASKVTIPTGTDLVFAAEPDSGYEVDYVEATIGGSTTTLSPDGGVYRVSASSLVDGKASIKVKALAIPEPEQEVVEQEVVEEEAVQEVVEEKVDETVESEAKNQPNEGAEAAGDAQEAVEEAGSKSSASEKADETAKAPEDEAAAEDAANAESAGAVTAAGSDELAGAQTENSPEAAKKDDGRNKEAKFSYTDNSVSVVATLSDPAVLPAGVKFVVTPVTSGSQEYNYDAYMAALNENSKVELNSGNTMLYDVAFMIPKLDENGKAIEGEYVEAQLEKGAVKIAIEFKQGQLSEAVADEVEVKHLPLKDSVREGVETTADATNIDSKDVIVENVDSLKANASKDEVTFDLDSLSLIAVTTTSGGQTTADTMTDYTLHNILSNYTMFIDGNVANANHMVGPVAVNGNASIGTIGTSAASSLYGQSVYIRGEAHTANIMSTNQPVYLGTTNIGKRNTWYGYDENGKPPLLYTNDYIDFNAAFSSIKGQINALRDSITWEDGNAHLNYADWAVNQGGPIIEFEAGHNYRITDVNSFYPWNNNTIRGAANAEADTIILIESSGTVTLPQISTGLNQAEVGNGTSITFLIPNATKVVLPQDSWMGHVVAPNAEVFQQNGNFNGCIVAKSISSCGEGHLWGYNGSVFSPAISGLKVVKRLVDSSNANVDFEGRTFQATLTGLNNAPMPAGAAGNTKTVNIASASATGFGDITFPFVQGKSSDVFEYTIAEQSTGLDGITYDTTVYHVKAYVTYTTVGNNGTTSVTWKYYKDGEQEQAYPSGGVTFTNTVQDRSVDVTLKAKKVLNGKNLSANKYTFQLSGDGGVSETKANDGNGDVTFSTITYTSEGTYNYTITEVLGEGATQENNYTVDGVAYDTSTKQVQVVVTKQNDGSLNAVVKYDGKAESAGGAATFTNTYTAYGEVQLTANKTINGKKPAEGAPAFTFELTGTDIPANKPLTATSDADGNVTFPKIAYTHAGDYTYTIQEVNDHKAGYTYDGKQAQVKVEVRDDGKGVLTATVIQNQANPTFNNTYTATGKVVLKAKKSFEGGNLADAIGQFSFVLEGDGIAKQTKTNGEGGAITFDEIKYNAPGTYHYTIKEAAGTQGGVTYDTKVVDVEVTVVDDNNGTLVATPVYSIGTGDDKQILAENDVVFANSYNAVGYVDLTATKELKNKTLEAGQFTFELLDEKGGLIDSRSNDGSGLVQFKRINYTAPGTYKYTIKEQKPADTKGITYDEHVAQVTVKVVDDKNGHLVATPTFEGATGENGTPHFVNTYKSETELVLGAQKTISGRDFKEGDSFTFTIQATDGGVLPAPMPAEDKQSVTITPKTGNTADIKFGPIKYTQDNAGKTYVYKIVETASANGANEGVTNDSRVHLVTVKVTDDGAGKLTASATYSPTQFVFENKYSAQGEVTISGVKSLKNANLSDFDFRFKLSDENGQEIETVNNAANGAVAFSKITYTFKDSVFKDSQGTEKQAVVKNGVASADFTYTVQELDDKAPGMTYDTDPRVVTVHVVDNGTRTLDVTYAAAEKNLEFKNTYNAQGAAVLFATKGLKEIGADGSEANRSFKAGDFEFELLDAKGKRIATATNDASGVATFEGVKELSYDMNDLTEKDGVWSGDFTYTIKEVVNADKRVNGKPYKNGISYDESSYTVTVHAKAKADGAMEITYGSDNAPNYAGAAFVNYYDANGKIELTGKKSMVGREFKEGDEYSFEIAATGENKDRAPLPGETVATVRPTAGTATSFAFGEISYKLSDLQKVKDGKAYDVFTYTVREVLPKEDGADLEVKDGVSYDKAMKTVVVTVTDNGDGTLNVKPEYSNGDLAFTNSYNANTSLVLKALKTLNGGQPGEGVEFSFKLAGGNPDKPVTFDAACAADGTVVFPELTYGIEDAGKTYKYTIEEVFSKEAAKDNGNGTYTLKPYTFDGHVQDIWVTIADNGDGTLTAVAKDGEGNNANVIGGDDAAATFANTYEAAGEINFSASKSYANAPLEAGKFTFQLLDGDNNDALIEEVGNDAGGAVVFKKIAYTQADIGHTYTYKIREKLPEAATADNGYTVGGITHDPSIHEVKVQVTDENHDGDIEATVVSGSTNAVFENAYNAYGSLSLGGTKTMGGRNFKAGDQFTFKVSADGQAPAFSEPEQTINPTSGSSASFSFGTVEFSLADLKANYQGNYANGSYTFKYVVTESASIDGVTNDGSKTVVVTVKDNGDGTLSVTNENGEQVAPVTFANTYTASGSAELKVQKAIGGDADESAKAKVLSGGAFAFQLVNADTGEAIGDPTPVDAQTGVASFALTYGLADLGGQASKTFNYTITEVGGTAPGVVYDTTARKAAVTVTDDGAGHLVTEVAYDGGAGVPTVTNGYDAKGSIVLKGAKTIEGRNFKTGDTLTFKLAPQLTPVMGNIPMPKDENGNVVSEVTIKPTAGKSADFAFPAIEFTSKDAGKTFYYALTESATMGEGADNGGVTNDSKTRLVIVTVGEDKGTGVLDVDAVYKTDQNEQGQRVAQFKNTYTTSGSVALAATKMLVKGNGQGAAAAGFTFQLLDDEGSLVDEQTTGANGVATFKELTFEADQAGNEYTYYICEKPDENATADNGYTYQGMTYSTERLPVKVVVGADDGSGKLAVTADYSAKGSTITNAYQAKGSATIGGTKELTGEAGRALVAGQFTFELKDANGETVRTATNAADGTFAFAPLTYTYDDVKDITTGYKEFKYTVTEVNSGAAGYTYDTSVKNVTVRVYADDNTGVLSTEVVESSEGIAFKNSYEAVGEITLEANKSLSGRALEDGIFEFTLTSDENNADKVAQTKANAGGKVTFDTITYKQPGNYRYYIAEVDKKADGYTYSTIRSVVDVTVVDDGQGKLVATMAEGAITPSFSNAYNAAGAITFKGTKSIEGRAFKAGDSFTFTVEAVGSAPEPATKSVTITPAKGQSAEFEFGKIDYTLADLQANYADNYKDGAYEFTYRIGETASIEGVQNAAAKTVTVRVSDNGDSTLLVKCFEGDAEINPGELAFVNSYIAAGTFPLQGKKTIANRAFKDGDEFTFTVEGSEGAPLPKKAVEGSDELVENTSVTIKPTIGNEEPFTFGTIYYTLENAGQEYTYTIHETATVAGVTNDVDKVVKVAVTDNGDGTLSVAPTYLNGDAAAADLTIANSYEGSGDAEIAVTKSYDNWNDANVFEFAITADEGTPMPEKRTVTATSSEQTASFGAIHFTTADLQGGQMVEGKLTKAFTYTVQEVVPASGRDGIIYDEAPRTVTITATDNGDGTITTAQAVTKAGEQADLTFKNAYDAVGSVTFQGEKTMGGRKMTADDSFSFTITQCDKDGKALKDLPGYKEGSAYEGKATVSGTSGKIEYPQITYQRSKDMLNADGTYATSKTFYYMVTEDVPSDATITDGNGNTVTYEEATAEQKKAGGFTKNGVTYAAAAKMFTVVVTDDGKGTLNAVATLNADAAEHDAAAAGDFEPSKSSAGQLFRSATNLNANYDSTVRIKLQGEAQPEPGHQDEKKTYDIVFVVDTSQSQGDTATALMNTLFEEAENGGYNVNVGIVKYYYVAKVTRYLDGTAGWNGSGSIAGTNLPAGILLGTEMLDKDTSVADENKYLVVIGDGDTYIYQNDNQVNSYTDKGVLRTVGDDAMVVTQIDSDYNGGKPFAGPGSYSWKYHNGGKEPDDYGAPDDWDAFFARVGPQVAADNGAYETKWDWHKDNKYNDATNAIPEAEINDHANSADTSLYYSLVNYRAASEKYHTYATFVKGNNDRPYGASFMAYLNGGASLDLSKLEDELVSDLAEGATQVAKGGTINDVIGYGYDDKGNTYDMDFVNKIETTDIFLNGRVLAKKENNGAFEFGTGRDGKPLFTFTYTGKQDAGTEGYKVQFSNEVLATDTVEMRYNVHLADPQTKAGTYGNYVETGTPEGVAGLLVSSAGTFTRGGSTQTFANPVVSYSALGFDNTYTASGSITFEGTKSMEGRKLKEGDAFSFTVTEGDKEVATGTSDETGKITYSPINYTLDDVGDHTYTVKETSVNDKGVTVDANEHTVTVTVSDNGDGTLKVEASDNAKALNFTNVYNASVEVQFRAIKELAGRAVALKAGEFTFDLIQDGKVIQTKTNAGLGDVQFDTIKYELKDVGKKFNYSIREQAGKVPGVTYDTTEHKFTVEVSDNGDGTLTATYSGYNPDTGITIKNEYKAEGEVQFHASKKLGAAAPGAKRFSFQLWERVLDSETGQAVWAEKGEPVESNAEGQAVFPAFKLYNPAERQYLITEVVPEGAVNIGGSWVYDNVVYGAGAYKASEAAAALNGENGSTAKEVTVVGNDKGDGTIEFTITYGEGNQTAAAFVNTNVQPATFPLKATKTMAGRNFNKDDAFTFSVAGEVLRGNTEATAPMPKDADGKDKTEVTIKPKDGTVAEVDLGTIAFTASDLGNTYRYTITESKENPIAGVEYDSAHTVDISVVEAGNGAIGIQAVYDEGLGNNADSIAFTNHYYAAGDTTLQIGKALTGRDLQEGEFYFAAELTGVKAANGDAVTIDDNTHGKNVARPSATAKGVATFNIGSFDQGDIGKTFTYALTEVKGARPGVTYDEHVYYVDVTVKDNGGGELGFDKAYYELVPSEVEGQQPTRKDLQKVTFDNDYKAEVADAQISVAKAFEGDRAWGDAESFTFTLTPQDNAPMAAANPEEGANAADIPNTVTVTKEAPTASFDKIKYDKAGTYKYVVTEVVPEGVTDKNPVKDGITYDTKQHEVVVNVVDDPDTGKLRATVAYTGEAGNATAANFKNTYKVTETTAAIQVTKNLDGRPWGDADKFSFQLNAGKVQDSENLSPMPADAKDAVVDIVTATPNHTAAFGTITFKSAGTYTYTISEIVPDGVTPENPTLKGVTYDFKAHAVTVTVVDDNAGHLVATVAYADEPADATSATVTNSFKADSVFAVLQASKVLNGKEATLADGDFEFELRDAATPEAEPLQTAKSKADGTVAFKAIEYKEVGEHNYTISEVVPEGAQKVADNVYAYKGVIYDTTQHTAKVTVGVNNEGKLVATVLYDGNTEVTEPAYVPVFTNTRLAHANIAFDKYHFGGTGTFDFELTALDAAGNARAGETTAYGANDTIVDNGTSAFTATVQNLQYDNGAAKVVFPEISYQITGNEAVTYKYLVKEKESSNEGMTADAAQYVVQVTVEPDGNVETSYELFYNGTSLGVTDDHSFYNNTNVKLGFNSLSAQSYTDNARRVSVYPKAQKYLNGKTDQLVGGDFQFELIDKATGKVLATTTNDENGVVAFYDEKVDPGLAYDEPGTYHYIIREVMPDNPIAGVTYDKGEIELTVVVERDGDGLVANASYNGPNGADPAFYNTKEGMDVTVQKVSRSGGEGLEGSTYALWMVGTSGDVLIQEATSDAQGFITFKDVDLIKGQKYYFKEVSAPSGHTVDPYRTAYFTLDASGTSLILAEKTSEDGWHSAEESASTNSAPADNAATPSDEMSEAI